MDALLANFGRTASSVQMSRRLQGFWALATTRKWMLWPMCTLNVPPHVDTILNTITII